ncbi:hypothetical protein [Micromonospora sp. NPDC005203]|uniref:hypothetical protein n=1 Tax=Micromonospora sp. NPDC005203 TaxID=3364226 RepID=UPI003681329F
MIVVIRATIDVRRWAGNRASPPPLRRTARRTTGGAVRGWHSFQAAALTTLGKAYLDVDPGAARPAFVDAQALWAQLGNTDMVAELGLLADTASGPGEPEPRPDACVSEHACWCGVSADIQQGPDPG